MKNLKKINENQEKLLLEFEEVENCDYVLEGITDTFSFEPIQIFSNNLITLEKEMINQYCGIRINFLFEGISIDTTNNLFFNNKLEKIEIGYLASYNKHTFVFYKENDEVYDKYILYFPKEDITIETEDFILLTDLVKNNTKCYVEGYKKIDKDFVLVGKSNYEVPFQINKKYNKNNAKKDLTIIVPCYNIEKFLARSLDSIIANTYNNLNIILVNNGSNDDTIKICKWYTNKYKFIKYYTTNQKSLCIARNIGVNHTKTDYINLFDGDDLVSPLFFETTMKNIKEYKADLAIAQVQIKNGFNNNTKILNNDEKIIYYDNYSKVVNNFDTRKNVFFVGVWGKIYKKELFDKVMHDDNNPLYEDDGFTRPLYSHCKSFICDTNVYYLWDRRNRLTTGSYTTEYTKMDMLKLWLGYFKSHARILEFGNKEYIETNKQIFLKNALTSIQTRENFKNMTTIIRNTTYGYIKYLDEKYDFSTCELTEELQKTLDYIRNNALFGWNIIEPIPEIFK